MKYTLLTALLLTCIHGYAQVIRGKVEGNVRFINIYRPLTIGANSFGLPVVLEPSKDGSFYYKSDLSRNGVYKIEIPGNSRNFHLQATDTLTLRIREKNWVIFLEGKENYKHLIAAQIKEQQVDRANALLNNIISQRGNVNGKKEIKVDYSSKIRGLSNYLEMEQKALEKNLSRLDTVGVDSIFRSKIRNEMQFMVLWEFLNISHMLLERSPKDSAAIFQFARSICDRADPINPTYYDQGLGWSLYLSYYLKFKYPLNSDENNPLVKYFDKYQAQVINCPSEIQEYELGEYCLTDYVLEEPDSTKQKRHEYFRKLFPNSPYNAAIESHRRVDINAVVSNTSYVFMDTLRLESLQDLASAMGGKPFFVDLWASWCPSCKHEFFYSKDLKTALDQRGVNMLYVSFNVRSAKGTWKQDVGRFDLNGFHLRVDDTMRVGQQLKEDAFLKGDIYLPRYMLYDGKGNLLSHKLSKPSTGQKLLDEIDRLLSKKAEDRK